MAEPRVQRVCPFFARGANKKRHLDKDNFGRGCSSCAALGADAAMALACHISGLQSGYGQPSTLPVGHLVGSLTSSLSLNFVFVSLTLLLRERRMSELIIRVNGTQGTNQEEQNECAFLPFLSFTLILVSFISLSFHSFIERCERTRVHFTPLFRSLPFTRMKRVRREKQKQEEGKGERERELRERWMDERCGLPRASLFLP